MAKTEKGHGNAVNVTITVVIVFLVVIAMISLCVRDLSHPTSKYNVARLSFLTQLPSFHGPFLVKPHPCLFIIPTVLSWLMPKLGHKYNK